MRIRICSACQTKVLPTSAGLCPACQSPFEDLLNPSLEDPHLDGIAPQNGQRQANFLMVGFGSSSVGDRAAGNIDSQQKKRVAREILTEGIDLLKLRSGIERELQKLERKRSFLQTQRSHLEAVERLVAEAS